MKKLFTAALLLSLAVLSAGSNEYKNVILMVPDGMSQGGLTLTRWYYGGNALSLDELACGMVRPYAATAPISDSAPAATAMATGFKSHTGFISVLPDKNDMPGLDKLKADDVRKPVATVLEAARLKNKATGIVATSEIMHATPAAFVAHDPSRKNYDNISEQMVYNNVNVIFGGGYKFFTPEVRKDKEDMIASLKAADYKIVRNTEEMYNVEGNKVVGLFADEAMGYDIDRDADKQPALAEMTFKAIDLLSKNKNGFFLMVEGSKIDWAAHANDPMGLISDIGAFDRAVRVALDFAKADGNTAILVCTDHGNSGVTIGDKSTNNDYDKQPLSKFIAPFESVSRTGEGIEALLNADRSNAKEIMKKYYGIADLNDTTETPLIVKAKSGEMNYVVGPMLAKRAKIGFTTTGHTGEDVVLYSYTPKDQLHGTIDNTDIAKNIAKWLDLDLPAVNSQLFKDAEKEFTAKGATVSTDKSDENNLVLVVKKGDAELKMPANKNFALNGDKKVDLDGVVVYNGAKWFVPSKAVELLK